MCVGGPPHLKGIYPAFSGFHSLGHTHLIPRTRLNLPKDHNLHSHTSSHYTRRRRTLWIFPNLNFPSTHRLSFFLINIWTIWNTVGFLNLALPCILQYIGLISMPHGFPHAFLLIGCLALLVNILA